VLSQSQGSAIDPLSTRAAPCQDGMEGTEKSYTLNLGGDTSIQVPAGAHVIVSIDDDAVPGMDGHMARVALRQAEERTKLVVECASLVKRMAQLDEEMAQYNEWQRYPTAHYADRVQMRFEEARRREAAAVPTMSEMLSRTPEIETPAYAVLASHESEGWEVRRYERFAVVSTNPNRAVESEGAAISAPTMGGAGAFQALAGYLFGGNQEGERLAMTTPVISASNAAGEREKMSFVMPSNFWEEAALAEAPTPKEGAGVSLESI